MKQIELLFDLFSKQLVTADYKPAFDKIFADEKEARKFLKDYSRCIFVGLCYPTANLDTFLDNKDIRVSSE